MVCIPGGADCAGYMRSNKITSLVLQKQMESVSLVRETPAEKEARYNISNDFDALFILSEQAGARPSTFSFLIKAWTVCKAGMLLFVAFMGYFVAGTICRSGYPDARNVV